MGFLILSGGMLFLSVGPSGDLMRSANKNNINRSIQDFKIFQAYNVYHKDLHEKQGKILDFPALDELRNTTLNFKKP